MKTYRKGRRIDIFGFLCYEIQEKKWYGWKTYYYSLDINDINELSLKLENKGNIVLDYI